MKEFTSEEFSQAIEKATRMGEEYNQLLSQVSQYMKDNNISWFDSNMTEFRFSVVAAFASAASAMEAINTSQ